MKSMVILALVGYAYAGIIAPALLTTGQSSQFRSQDNIGNYAFGYNEDHSTGGTFRRESGGPGVQVGSYGLRDADGRTRVVNYVADAAGFRANIQSNEPGVEPKDPAHVLINKAQAIVAPTLAAPVAAPLIAAPAVAHYSHEPYVAHSPLAHSSYSTVTQHHAPAVHYASAPVVSHYGAHLAAPLAAPVAYATKTIHGGWGAAPLVNAW